MIKLRLILIFLIAQHNLTICIDIKSAIGKAIREKKDFNELTPAENKIYTRQINFNLTWAGMNLSPLAYAAYWGNTSAFNWLLSKKANDDWTKVLNSALTPVFTKAEPSIISTLLIKGACIDYKIVCPLLKAKLIESEKYNMTYPHLADSNVSRRIRQTQQLFDDYHNQLRWTWIKAAALIDSGRVEIVEE